MLKLIPFDFYKTILAVCLLTCMVGSSGEAAFTYQDFEPGNGTPVAVNAPSSASAEYGWGFNGAVVEHNSDPAGVHAGGASWKVTIPAGEPVQAGSAVPSQSQTYQVNLVPECHDRLSFWVWSDPSQLGDHTVMVKFFDHGAYKHRGIGVWTAGKARYRQWSEMTVLFSQLPSDFNLRRLDKIEFFHYWDGTYYYDDILVRSEHDKDSDNACLNRLGFRVCADAKPNQSQISRTSTGENEETDRGRCQLVFESNREEAHLDRLSMSLMRRVRTLGEMGTSDESR